MKQKIGIGLFIILNLTFFYIIVVGAIMPLGLIVAPMGADKGLEFAKLTTYDILVKLIILSIIVLWSNYFLTKKMIENKRPFLTSLSITAFGIIIFIPLFISARKSFLNYQNGITQLEHYLDRQTITEAQIIAHQDTIQVEQLDNFITDIGLAKYKKGPWKYAKTIHLIFKRKDGSNDSISTNGQLFGPYKGKYFSTDQNVIEKYIANEKKSDL